MKNENSEKKSNKKKDAQTAESITLRDAGIGASIILMGLIFFSSFVVSMTHGSSLPFYVYSSASSYRSDGPGREVTVDPKIAGDKAIDGVQLVIDANPEDVLVPASQGLTVSSKGEFKEPLSVVYLSKIGDASWVVNYTEDGVNKSVTEAEYSDIVNPFSQFGRGIDKVFSFLLTIQGVIVFIAALGILTFVIKSFLNEEVTTRTSVA